MYANTVADSFERHVEKLTAALMDGKTKQVARKRNTSRRFFRQNKTKTCHFCEFTSINIDDFNGHLINQHCDMIFCCDICNQYLPRIQLMPHMTEHATTCKEIENVKTSNTTKDKESPYQCEKCGKEFQSISGIKYHMNAQHTRLETFICEKCNSKFPSKRILQNHYRSIHRDTRNYTCNVCGKSFKADSTLYTHSKVHIPEKPYECGQCDKRFRLKHHLTEHMVQHQDFDDKYECNWCHKRFAAAANLRKHKKIHDQTLSDFKCHICGAKMKQKRYLRQHMRKVHLQSLTTTS